MSERRREPGAATEERTGGARPRVVVVGGGISGLAAAWFLHRDGAADLAVTVLEGSPRIGGKLRVSEVAGVPVDEGAESLLLRRPEASTWPRPSGLGDDLEARRDARRGVWTRGELRPIPSGTVMGVPVDLRALARTGLLTAAGARPRAASTPGCPAPRLAGDVAVGDVRRRAGWAARSSTGWSSRCSAVSTPAAPTSSRCDATVPALCAARPRRPLAARRRPARPRSSRRGERGAGPVFGGTARRRGPAAGSRSPGACGDAGVTIATGATVRELHRRTGLGG